MLVFYTYLLRYFCSLAPLLCYYYIRVCLLILSLFKHSAIIKHESAKLCFLQAVVPYLPHASLALVLYIPNALLALVLYALSCPTYYCASRVPCPACLLPYVPSCLRCLVPNVPCAPRALVSYVLLCTTCLVPYVLSCPTYHTCSHASRDFDPMWLRASRFMSLFSLRTLLSCTLLILCPNNTFWTLEFPCLTLLFFCLFATCDFLGGNLLKLKQI